MDNNPKPASKPCCDAIEPLYEMLVDIFHDPDFFNKCLKEDPDLKERIFEILGPNK
ncbi:unnamed protein product [Meloidogyne enterolobii]|uniref:Uncharacterized protein n=2 Tax=Meloidogyne enterolobii TaxID=390850 RepID=A0A6V7WKZ1_MELEN|nr:unnamed protein product [Meloidogyne enterolobii]CAD2187646.1 unnamed protein product [Meloidogyne enterolobii]